MALIQPPGETKAALGKALVVIADIEQKVHFMPSSFRIPTTAFGSNLSRKLSTTRLRLPRRSPLKWRNRYSYWEGRRSNRRQEVKMSESEMRAELKCLRIEMPNSRRKRGTVAASR